MKQNIILGILALVSLIAIIAISGCTQKAGILDCIDNPEKCDFPIDEATAIQIAKNAGLEDGITDWKTSLHWYGGDLKTYVWTVQNTLSETPHSKDQGYSASGKTVVIDANSGEVKEVSQWQAME